MKRLTMKSLTTTLLATFCLLLVFMAPLNINMAYAQETEAEARYLISIANEIENLKALAQKAAATADTSQRVQFDYAALQSDLAEIQRALEQHVKEPSRSPRVISAINARYTKAVKDE